MAGFGGKNLIQVKELFFDRKGLLQTMHKTELKVLAKAGALGMTVARRLIRPGKGTSQEGKPPKGHGKQLLRRNVFFGIDKSLADPDCLIGPVALNQTYPGKDGQPVRGTVPRVLEASGEIWIREVFKWGRWRRIGRRAGGLGGLPTRLRKVRVGARPFMGPTLTIIKPRLAGLWRGAFKK